MRISGEIKRALNLKDINNRPISVIEAQGIIQAALDGGLGINEREDTPAGYTLFHYAVMQKQVPMIQYLLQLGADTTIVSHFGSTVFGMGAADSDKLEKEIYDLLGGEPAEVAAKAAAEAVLAVQAEVQAALAAPAEAPFQQVCESVAGIVAAALGDVDGADAPA